MADMAAAHEEKVRQIEEGIAANNALYMYNPGDPGYWEPDRRCAQEAAMADAIYRLWNPH